MNIKEMREIAEKTEESGVCEYKHYVVGLPDYDDFVRAFKPKTVLALLDVAEAAMVCAKNKESLSIDDSEFAHVREALKKLEDL